MSWRCIWWTRRCIWWTRTYIFMINQRCLWWNWRYRWWTRRCIWWTRDYLRFISWTWGCIRWTGWCIWWARWCVWTARRWGSVGRTWSVEWWWCWSDKIKGYKHFRYKQSIWHIFFPFKTNYLLTIKNQIWKSSQHVELSYDSW